MAKLRPLGASGLSVAPLILGGNVFWERTMDRATGFSVLDAYVARIGAGAVIDTADYYVRYLPGGEGGESETMIGAWLAQRKRRDDVMIVTKVGAPMGEGLEGLSAAYISKAIEASLRRLNTDYVDVYLTHTDDAKTPQEETLGAFNALIKAGKVRSIGMSQTAPERVRAALDTAKAKGLTPYTSLQVEYNLLERAYEANWRQLCLDYNVGCTPYFAVAQGYLTGKYRSAGDLGKSRRGGGVKKYLEGKGPAMLAAMDAIAAERSASLAAIALAWLMAKPGVVAPIASATNAVQVEEIAASIDLALTAEEMQRLDAAGA